MPGKEPRPVTEKLRRRRLLGAIGAGPLVYSQTSVDYAPVDVSGYEQVNELHLVEARIEHDADIPEVVIGHSDTWLRYKTSADSLVMEEGLGEHDKKKFRSESKLVVGNEGTDNLSTTFPWNAKSMTLPIETGITPVPVKAVRLADPYRPPQVELSPGKGTTVKLESENNTIRIPENSEKALSFNNRDVSIEIGKNEIRRFEATPLMKITNHGKVSVYNSVTEEKSRNQHEENEVFK